MDFIHAFSHLAGFFWSVLNLSDMVLGNGNKILLEAYNGVLFRTSSYNDWPQQGELPRSFWDFWHHALKQCLIASHCRLLHKYQLGCWLSGEGVWWHNSDCNILLHTSQQSWSV